MISDSLATALSEIQNYLTDPATQARIDALAQGMCEPLAVLVAPPAITDEQKSEGWGWTHPSGVTLDFIISS